MQIGLEIPPLDGNSAFDQGIQMLRTSFKTVAQSSSTPASRAPANPGRSEPVLVTMASASRFEAIGQVIRILGSQALKSEGLHAEAHRKSVDEDEAMASEKASGSPSPIPSIPLRRGKSAADTPMVESKDLRILRLGLLALVLRSPMWCVSDQAGVAKLWDDIFVAHLMTVDGHLVGQATKLASDGIFSKSIAPVHPDAALVPPLSYDMINNPMKHMDTYSNCVLARKNLRLGHVAVKDLGPVDVISAILRCGRASMHSFLRTVLPGRNANFSATHFPIPGTPEPVARSDAGTAGINPGSSSTWTPRRSSILNAVRSCSTLESRSALWLDRLA